jgi:hypothetical protein
MFGVVYLLSIAQMLACSKQIWKNVSQSAKDVSRGGIIRQLARSRFFLQNIAKLEETGLHHVPGRVRTETENVTLPLVFPGNRGGKLP